MKMKLLMLIGALAISMTLAACATPAGVMPPGLTREIGADQDETGAAPLQAETAEPTEAAEPTETVDLTPAPEVTEVPEATETAEATDDGARAGCPGNPGGTPPTAGAIANANQVSEGEIMGWFCQGFGFGEIKKAYVWAKLTGKTVDELLALKQQGMGWGEIADSLDIKPGGKPCWAGSDQGANSPDCVKPGGKANKDNKGKPAGKGSGNGGDNGNGNGNGKGGGKGGKP